MSSKSKVSNRNLHQAARAKKDEFYTQLTDIEKELKHYKKHLCADTKREALEHPQLLTESEKGSIRAPDGNLCEV